MTNETEESLVGQLIDAWESADDAPALEDVCAFKPQTTPRQRADAVLVDQRFRWAQGLAVRAEEYFERCPELAADPELRLDIVYGELRARGGQSALLDEFRQRFPDLAEALALQLEVSTWMDSDAQTVDTMIVPMPKDETSISPGVYDPAPLSFSDFVLQECLGKGAMGEVYRATQRSLNKPVAVKLLKPRHSLSQEAADRFLREARATASLRHPHIVDVHGVGRCPAGGYFLVMDLIEGRSLQEEIADRPLRCEQAALAVADIAGALQHAHERGVIHRDLKPSNVLRTGDGQIVVADFGLAKLLVDDEAPLSMEGAVIGTPQFMAPEQIDSQRGPVGPAADVYGLGGLLYSLLAGRPPVGGDSLVKTISEVLSDRPVTPPSTVVKEIDPQLERICLDCLEKDPQRRPASAGEVRRRVLAWLEKRSSPTSQINSAGVDSTGRRSMLPWAFGAAAAGLIILFALLAWKGNNTQRPIQGAQPDKDNAAVLPELTASDTTIRWQVEIYGSGDATDPLPKRSHVASGDRLRIHVELSEPKYVYAFWVGSDGSVQWLDADGPPRGPATKFSLPSVAGDVFPVAGDAGTETCLLLLRREPLVQANLLAPRLTPQWPLPELDLDMPLADGMLLAPSQSQVPAEVLARLADPSRVIGDAEPLLAGKAGAAIAKWRRSWPTDLGHFHYLAIPHRVQ